jgi:hypothetical protein
MSGIKIPLMQTLLVISLIFLASACGQKSKVTPLFDAIPLRQSHGDGEYAVFTVKLPLSDQSLDTYDSPVDPDQGVARVPLLGDVLRLVTQSTFNLGAQLGLGKQNIIITQPIPDLSSKYLNSISIKRVFFHIDQKDITQNRPSNMWMRFREFLRGGSRLDFSFINELNINFRMLQEGSITSYTPEINTDVVPERDLLSPAQVAALPEGMRPVEILKYHKKKRTESIRSKDFGPMLVVYGDFPVKVRSILRRDPDMKELIKEIVVVNKSLFIELKEQELVREKFYELLERNETQLTNAGISKIEPCNDDVCMDVKVNNQNMLPMLLKGDRLRIETYIDSSKVPPKSFQLKGFIEFEVKLDVPL